ncbi:hypothetical protein B0H14DRAFT_2700937, partial [Mycena olivaceomarginata]
MSFTVQNYSASLTRPSFTGKSRTSNIVPLQRCPSKAVPRVPSTRQSPTASCSSPSSSDSPESDDSSSPAASSSKVRRHASKSKRMVIRVVSTMLLIPMPYLDDEKAEADVLETSEPHGLKNMFSRRPSTPKRRRNSLVLPEVPMPDGADDAADFPPRPHHRSTLGSPPPTEERRVRFSLPPPPIERRRTDEEPAWPDFM